ncbi:MAG: CBS domain-containing protein [Mariniphaga sp.]
MKTNNKLNKIVREIKQTDKEVKLTTRELFGLFNFGKRTTESRRSVDEFLNDNQLEVVPDYMKGGMEEQVTLRHKKRAKIKKSIHPVQNIGLLHSANKDPITVTREAKLKEAITLMMMHNFSQLPVVSGSRTVHGVITWESVGYGLTNDCKSELVKDFISSDVTIVDYETPLLDAVPLILENQFVLVQGSDKSLCGIVTLTDISAQFLKVSEPFILLEQIENHVRQILDGKFLVDELKEYCQFGDFEREIEYIDDLSFGDYIRVIQKPENWDRLQLSIERTHFIKHLDRIREIRNDIMHFDPDGINPEQKEELIKMAKFLAEVIKFE